MKMLDCQLPTTQEIKQIRANDPTTISKYYFANYELLKRYAKAFCRRVNDFRDFDDLLQQLYVDFHTLSFENAHYFGHDCFKSFCRLYYGDRRKREQLKDGKMLPEITILDKPIQGADKEVCTIGETIASDFDTFIMAFPRPSMDLPLFDFLCGYLAKEQKRVFSEFYWTGQTYNEVAETLGKNVRTVKRTREQCFVKFRQHKQEIQEFIERCENEAYSIV